jgi:hypothetical protein
MLTVLQKHGVVASHGGALDDVIVREPLLFAAVTSLCVDFYFFTVPAVSVCLAAIMRKVSSFGIHF